jgi:hypothetical protein
MCVLRVGEEGRFWSTSALYIINGFVREWAWRMASKTTYSGPAGSKNLHEHRGPQGKRICPLLDPLQSLCSSRTIASGKSKLVVLVEIRMMTVQKTPYIWRGIRVYEMQ